MFQVFIRILFPWTNFFTHICLSKCENSCSFLTTPKHRYNASLTKNTITNPCPLFIYSRVRCSMLQVRDDPTCIYSGSIYNKVTESYIGHHFNPLTCFRPFQFSNFQVYSIKASLSTFVKCCS